MTARGSVLVDGHEVRFTNPDKIVYPQTGTTKQDVLDYYLAIAPLLVPQSALRPATRKRWVSGVGTEEKPGQVFWRKNIESGAPSWVPTETTVHKKTLNIYPLVDNAAVLAWFTQLGALEIHVPQWRFNELGKPANPDRMVWDLDPGPGVTMGEVAQLALDIRDIFAQLGQPTYPVTSGSKGIHIYVGLNGLVTAGQANAAAKKFAQDLEARWPNRVVASQKKALREGKILVDWSQNNIAKSTICPYSLRGRTQPMVAAPRTWEEIEAPGLTQLNYQQVLERASQGLHPMSELGLRQP